MSLPPPAQIPRKKWRSTALIFLSLLPLMAIFHLVMWFGFTRTLFRPETGDLKRIGYLVGITNGKAELQKSDPKTGYTVLGGEELAKAPEVKTLFFGDSFAGSLAQAYSIKRQEPVGLAGVNWDRGNGLAQIEAWVKDGWFRQHGVRTIVVERVEYAWLNTFSDAGDASLDIPWNEELAGHMPPAYQRAKQWTFANNGNFKVLFCNVAYLFSPTAWKMTDTCVVRLTRPFFTGPDAKLLLFYRGDLKGALTPDNEARFERSLENLKKLSDLCHQQGLDFYLIVPPVKSFLYYDWVVRPFYPDSKLLETLREKGAESGYVDLKRVFHEKLAAGCQDLYYPDDAHWNFPTAEIAAEQLIGAQSARR